MIIAIAANENHIGTSVDEHFGKCMWYCLYDTETKTSSFVENPGYHLHEKAGCEAVEFLVKKNICIAIAGRFGSKVVDFFRKNGVQMIIPESNKTLIEIIKQIKLNI